MTGQTTPGSAPLRYRAGPRRQTFATLLDGLRTDGGAHVVTGEPGGGRTAFLEFAARAFRAGPVWHVRAEPACFPRPHSGLRSLLRAARHAGRVPGDGAAEEVLLDVLRAASVRSPLLVCVDDAHLWDAASRAVLGRVAARVHTADDVHRVGLLVTVPGHRPVEREWAALPVLQLAPLAPGDAAGLLHDLTDGAVDPVVRDELVTEAQGNPALLLALAHRLSPAQLRGDHALPRPLADAGTLTAVAGGCPSGRRPDDAELLLAVAAAMRATGEQDAEAALVRRAVDGTGGRDDGTSPGPSGPPQPPELLAVPGGRLRFRSPLLGRAVYAGAPSERRRAVHRSLAAAHPAPRDVPALLHRSWAAPGPDAVLAAELEAAAADTSSGTPPALRRTARVRAAELTPDDALRARRYTAAAEQALLAGHPAEALRLLDDAGSRPAPAPVRGRAELLRGRVLLADGPVDDARESFLLAAGLLSGPGPKSARSEAAVLGAADAAWAAGDRQGCLRALTHGTHEAHETHGTREAHDVSAPAAVAGTLDLRAVDADPTGPREAAPRETPEGSSAHRGATPVQPSGPPPALLRDHRDGMRAVLLGRFDLAAAPLTRVVDRGRPAADPERLLRSAAAALLHGDDAAARRPAA
ncbi:LuxR family transcriptional regulator, partial [Streptomyces prasinus]